jgi:hypothetical protein
MHRRADYNPPGRQSDKKTVARMHENIWKAKKSE